MRRSPRIHPDLFCAPPSHQERPSGPEVRWPPPRAEAWEACRGRLLRHYPARFVVLACAIAAEAEGDEDLFVAYRILAEVSNLRAARRAGLRAVAAVNMAPVLAALGNVQALLVADAELVDAWPSASAFEGLEEAMMSARQMVHAGLASLRARGMLRWDGEETMRPCDDVASERIPRLPASLDGAWRGVLQMLRGWGLDVEGPCRVPDPVKVLPKRERLDVGKWTRAAA